MFVSPRLETDEADATLALFPDFQDWPQQVASIRDGNLLTVSFNAETPVAASIVNSNLNSALWKALFPPETRVCPYDYKSFMQPPPITYSHRAVHDKLKEIYQRETGRGYSPSRDNMTTRTIEQPTMVEQREPIDGMI